MVFAPNSLVTATLAQATIFEALNRWLSPVILVLAYYRCPMLCTQVLNGLVDVFKSRVFGLKLGEDFQVVTVSFDSRERDLPDLVRASVHYFTTDEELDRAVNCVRAAAEHSHASVR